MDGEARMAAWLRNGVPGRTHAANLLDILQSMPAIEAMGYAKSYEDLGVEKFSERFRLAACPEEDILALVSHCRELREDVRNLDSSKLLNWVRLAQTTPAEPVGDQDADEPPGEPMPRFPMGLPALEAKTDGGGYGMTVIAAPPKCGKSMLALAAAVRAAEAGWRVLYLNGELTRGEMANRIRRFCKKWPPGFDVVENLSVHPIELGATIPHVIRKLEERIDIEDKRILFVVDSINRIVDQSQADSSEHGYWHCMRNWSEFFRQCSKVSEGRVASIVVSELNQGGHVKGRSLEYAADLVIRITPTQDDVIGFFEMDVPYARSSAGGPLGTHQLNWQEGRFVFADGGRR